MTAFWAAVKGATLGFSGIRLHNAGSGEPGKAAADLNPGAPTTPQGSLS
jgi:hypothetical protein